MEPTDLAHGKQNCSARNTLNGCG